MEHAFDTVKRELFRRLHEKLREELFHGELEPATATEANGKLHTPKLPALNGSGPEARPH